MKSKRYNLDNQLFFSIRFVIGIQVKYKEENYEKINMVIFKEKRTGWNCNNYLGTLIV